jgi:hypothetical protein
MLNNNANRSTLVDKGTSFSQAAFQDMVADATGIPDLGKVQNNQSVNSLSTAPGQLSISGFQDLISQARETNLALNKLIEIAQETKVIDLKVPTSVSLPPQRLYYSVKA